MTTLAYWDDDLSNSIVRDAAAELVAYIDSRPRQAVQQASAEVREPDAYMQRYNSWGSDPNHKNDKYAADRWEKWEPASKACGESTLFNKEHFPDRYWMFEVKPLYAAIALQAPDTMRDDALEDAAKACIDEQVDYAAPGTEGDRAYNSATVHCATTIRAMKSTVPKGTNNA